MLYKYYQFVILVIYYNIGIIINLNFMVHFIIKLYFGFYYTVIDNRFFVIKIMGFGTPWKNCKFKNIISKTFSSFREG